jgi:hypothetical protein
MTLKQISPQVPRFSCVCVSQPNLSKGTGRNSSCNHSLPLSFSKLDTDISLFLVFFISSTLTYLHSPKPPTPPGFLQHVRNRKCVAMGPACVGHYFKTRQAGPPLGNVDILDSRRILSNTPCNFNMQNRV